jgi:hypothetical protein
MLTVYPGYLKANTLKYAVTSVFCKCFTSHPTLHLDTVLYRNLIMILTKSLLLLMTVILYILSTMHFMCHVHAVILKSV